ncbi:MAG TPA: hypothetical protein VIM33_04895 [Gaiellaceae bacterium]
MIGFVRSFWGSIVMLIALLVVLEHAGGASRILGAGGNFTTGIVKAFRA